MTPSTPRLSRRMLLALGVAPWLPGCNMSSSDMNSANRPGGTATGATSVDTSSGSSTEDPSNGQTPSASEGSTSTGGVILAFGDSNTSSTYAESWPAKLARITNRTVVASSKGNETTAQGAGRLAAAIRNAKPTSICILYGTVDAMNNVAAGTAVSNLAAMVEVARSMGVRDIVVGTPPAAPSKNFGALVSQIASGVRSAMPGRGAKVADVHGATGNLALMIADGFHLNDSGMAVVAAEFAEAL